MNILDILDKDMILADLNAKNKRAVIEEMSILVANHEKDVQLSTLVGVLLDREKLGSTGIGDGVAIPHGKLQSIDEVIAVFGRSKEGIDFDSMDENKAYLFFLLVAPEKSTDIHLKALARISRLMKDSQFRMDLMEAKSREEIYDAFAKKEAKY